MLICRSRFNHIQAMPSNIFIQFLRHKIALQTELPTIVCFSPKTSPGFLVLVFVPNDSRLRLFAGATFSKTNRGAQSSGVGRAVAFSDFASFSVSVEL